MWSDIVYDNAYELMPLRKVEEYIKTKKHLQEILAAKEVTQDGTDIHEMDAKLL